MAIITTLVIVCLIQTASAQNIRERLSIHTSGAGAFKLVNELGVRVSGRNSIVFQVKSCASAVIAVSNIASISASRGHYFLLMIGNKGNTETQVMDSCFTCNRTFVKKGQLLDCKVFKPFWLLWDGQGMFKFGEGEAIGRNVFIHMQGKKTPYLVNFIHVTSSMHEPAVFNFTKDTDLRIMHPLPDGSTIVTLNETEAVNSTLLQVILYPDVPDVELTIAGEGADDFFMDNKTILIRQRMDFEKRQFYALTVGTRGGLRAAFVVSLLDINDEVPVITVSPGEVPEEIAVGTVIGGFYTARDADKDDNLTYTLSGNASDSLDPLGKGQFRVMKLMDREANDTNLFKNLTLNVTDLAGHRSMAVLKVRLTDVNDNAPECEKNLVERSVIEKLDKDTVLLNLGSLCHDADIGENARLTYTILGETDIKYSFNIRGKKLVARAGKFEQIKEVMFFVLVEDNPENEAKRRSYIQVKVKVMSADNVPPFWTSKEVNQTGVYSSVNISSAAAVGVMITSINASDPDGDKLVYSFIDLRTDTEEDGRGLLRMGSVSGQISVGRTLSGVKHVTATVSASDGVHSITARLKVMVIAEATSETPKIPTEATQVVSSAPDPTVHPVDDSLHYFDRRVYVIPSPVSSDNRGPVLDLSVVGLSPIMKLMVEASAVKFYTVEKHRSWQLIYTGAQENKARRIPKVFSLHVKNIVNMQILEEVYVVMDTKKCKAEPSSKPEVQPPKRVEQSVEVEAVKTEATDHVIQPSKLAMTSRKGCPGGTSPQTMTLIIVAGCQGAVLIGIASFFIYKHGLKKMNPSKVRPKRQKPGYDEAFKTDDFPTKDSNIYRPEPKKGKPHQKTKYPKKEFPSSEKNTTLLSSSEQTTTTLSLSEKNKTTLSFSETNKATMSESDLVDDLIDLEADADEAKPDNTLIDINTRSEQTTSQAIDIPNNSEHDDSDGDRRTLTKLEAVDADVNVDDVEERDVREEPSLGVVLTTVNVNLGEELEQRNKEGDINQKPDGDDDGRHMDTEEDMDEETHGSGPPSQLDNKIDDAADASTAKDDGELDIQADASEDMPNESEKRDFDCVNSDVPEEDDDDEEEDEDQEEDDEDDCEDDGGPDVGGGVTAVTIDGAQDTEGVVKKKRRRIKKPKEKPKKVKKAKLRKIDFTQSPYCLPPKESKE